MLQQNMQGDVIVYNQAIDACARSSSWQHAVQLLSMLEGTLSPDTISYNAVLSACSSGEQWQIGIQMISSMQSSQMADTISYNAALRGCVDSKQWPLALGLMREMKEQKIAGDKITYTTVLSGLEQQWELAMHLLQEIEREHIQPDCQVCTAAVGICGKAFLWQQALDIFDQALVREIPCDTFAYNTLITACGLGLQWEVSLSLMHAMRKRHEADSVTLGSAIVACSDARRWQFALSSLSFLDSGGKEVELSTPCFNAILSGCNWEAGLAVLHEMDIRSVEKDSLTYSTMIAALEEADRWEEAFQLLDERLLKVGDDRIRRSPFAPRSFLREVLSSGQALELRRFIRSCAREPPIGIRLNPLKARQDILEHLYRQGWKISPLPWLDNGFVVRKMRSQKRVMPQLTGDLYFQEPTSMLPVEVLRRVVTESHTTEKEPKPLNVLDLCAAPGSKSTQLGSWLLSTEPRGFLVANEIDQPRAKKLDAALTRMAVTNVLLTCEDGRFFGEIVPEAFDAILVDVPCTCEGNVRKDATALLSAAGATQAGPAHHKEELVERQQALLQSAWKALKPGGYLVFLVSAFDNVLFRGFDSRVVGAK